MTMKLPQVDPVRMAEEWAADEDVLANLVANGDVPSIPRAIDVSFRGSEEALLALTVKADEFGFTMLDREEQDGALYLFLEREQKTDEASIKALTEICLQIEILFGVEYDGWGCEAMTTGSVH